MMLETPEPYQATTKKARVRKKVLSLSWTIVDNP
jgi:hypothetical protein